ALLGDSCALVGPAGQVEGDRNAREVHPGRHRMGTLGVPGPVAVEVPPEPLVRRLRREVLASDVRAEVTGCPLTGCGEGRGTGPEHVVRVRARHRRVTDRLVEVDVVAGV